MTTGAGRRSKGDDIWIMLAKPNAHEKFEKIGFTGSFYFTTDD
jgi:hypothetical protein